MSNYLPRIEYVKEIRAFLSYLCLLYKYPQKYISPMALRTSMTEFYFIPLVLQALFHIPQVRETLSRYQLKDDYGQITDVLTPGLNDGGMSRNYVGDAS